MSYILTENEKVLLSAYHDGELSGSEFADAEKLLQNSAEARRWLRDAGTVGKLSRTSVVRPGAALRSSKLTGQAIASVASRRGGLGTFSNMVHSPWSAVGAVGLLLAGTMLLTDPFSSEGEKKRPLLAGLAGTTEILSIGPEEEAVSVIPPITPSDLAGFALEGRLPMNSERTEYLALASGEISDEQALLEIEAGLGSLERNRLRTLDSLTELLRTAVLRRGGDAYAVRPDLPTLRQEMIEQIQTAPLSSATSTRLEKARLESKRSQEEVADRLAAEMARMREELMAGGQSPYVEIQGSALVEGPTGEGKKELNFMAIGKRSRLVILNPAGVEVREKNPTIAAALTPAVSPHRRKSVARETNSAKGREDATGLSIQSPQATGTQSEEGWRNEVTDIFMADVTITLSLTRGQVIISDDVTSTWTSPILEVGEEEAETFYGFGAYLTKLTDSLNATVSRIVIDTATSARDRAERILRIQDEYRRRVERMIERMHRYQEEERVDSVQNNEDDAADVEGGDNRIKIEEYGVHENRTEEESAHVTVPCPAWEDCSGVS